MESKLIQFRLKDDARQALESLALPGESLNLCAQRLLMEALGADSPVDRASKAVDRVDNAVDTVDRETLIDEITPTISERVLAEAQARQADLLMNLLEKNLPAQIEAYLGKG